MTEVNFLRIVPRDCPEMVKSVRHLLAHIKKIGRGHKEPKNLSECADLQLPYQSKPYLISIIVVINYQSMILTCMSQSVHCPMSDQLTLL